jgi:hypothetical protein
VPQHRAQQLRRDLFHRPQQIPGRDSSWTVPAEPSTLTRSPVCTRYQSWRTGSSAGASSLTAFLAQR